MRDTIAMRTSPFSRAALSFFTLQGEKGAKGDPGPMGLPVCIFSPDYTRHAHAHTHTYVTLSALYIKETRIQDAQRQIECRQDPPPRTREGGKNPVSSPSLFSAKNRAPKISNVTLLALVALSVHFVSLQQFIDTFLARKRGNNIAYKFIFDQHIRICYTRLTTWTFFKNLQSGLFFAS